MMDAPMLILIACERSGIVREAFRKRGHEAWSCDLEPSEDNSPYHLQMDAIEAAYSGYWDMMIAHPECRYLCSSGLHWNTKDRTRNKKTEEAAAFALKLWMAPIEKVVLENPIGRLSKVIGKPSQIIQPYQFGEDASKRTCLWIRGLKLLTGTRFVEPRMVNGKPRWSNQTDSGQNRLGPSETRSMDRARTYPLVADAMAELWGKRSGWVVAA